MFDRCWLWRRKLSRQADGKLPPAQLGALQDHVAHCRNCQAAAQADQSLSDVLRTHHGLIDSDVARTLDDVVVATVFADRVATRAGRRHNERTPLPAPNRVLPFVYLIQIIGGGLTAAAVTALFLVPALHPGVDTSPAHRYSANIERSEPPVPLESLLQTTSPRAALLWTMPQAHLHITVPSSPIAEPVPVVPANTTRPSSPRTVPAGRRQRHTMADSHEILGV